MGDHGRERVKVGGRRLVGYVFDAWYICDGGDAMVRNGEVLFGSG